MTGNIYFRRSLWKFFLYLPCLSTTKCVIMANGKHYWLSEKEMSKLHKPQVENIKNTLDSCIANGVDISMAVQPHQASYNAVALSTIIGIAQHKDEWIKFLAKYKIQLVFADAQGNNIPIDKWSYSKEFQAWFIHLRNTFPGILFFLAQKEARFLLVAAEIISSIPSNEVHWHKENNTATFHFSDTEMDELEDKLKNQCESFVHYCFDTSINPEYYI